LAGQWFAPHYAEPDSWICDQAAVLRAAPSPVSEALGDLGSGESFATLEISGDWAWGFRERDGRVGYVEAHALRRAGKA
jgi:hypothetical protein